MTNRSPLGVRIEEINPDAPGMPFVVQLDDRGRIQFPETLRKVLHMEKGDWVHLEILRIYPTSPLRGQEYKQV